MKLKHRMAAFFRDVKNQPTLLWYALASLFVPGLGQLLNNQKRKAAIWFLVPALLVGVELASSQWFTMKQAYLENPVMETETALAVRDYGGFFTRGLWGLGTLGRLVIDQSYRGRTIMLSSNTLQGESQKLTWLTADNSMKYLALGLIALIFLVIAAVLWLLGVFDAYDTRKRYLEKGKKEGFMEWAGRIWEEAFVYVVMAVPFLAILFVTVLPIVFTALIAFTNFNYRIKLGSSTISWVGFNTFRQLAVDPAWLRIFGEIFVWTVLWAVLSTLTVYIGGFINALVVESPMVRGKKIWRVIMIIPWAFPGLITLMMFRNVFHNEGLMAQGLAMLGGKIPSGTDPGVLAAMQLEGKTLNYGGVYYYSKVVKDISTFFHNVGLSGQAFVGSGGIIDEGRLAPIYWLSNLANGSLAKLVVILTNLWMGAPWHMMMIIGVLQTIPRELYEAAHIDGATAGQRFRFITLPMVLTATVPTLIMTFTYNFNNFGAIYFLNGGGPGWKPERLPDSLRIISAAMPGQTDILISWIYKLTFTRDFEQYNVAAVYTILIFLIIGGISVPTMLRSKSFTEEAGD